jgi:hypothetical protein
VIKEDPLRFRRGWARRYRLMLVPGVALALVAGVHLADRDDPEEVSRSVTTPPGEDGASNMKIIEKDQLIDADTFERAAEGRWPR